MEVPEKELDSVTVRAYQQVLKDGSGASVQFGVGDGARLMTWARDTPEDALYEVSLTPEQYENWLTANPQFDRLPAYPATQSSAAGGAFAAAPKGNTIGRLYGQAPMANGPADQANPPVEPATKTEIAGSDGEQPNAALQALLDKEADATPWYEKAWSAAKAIGSKVKGELTAVVQDPGEAAKGVGKGLVNTFTSDLWNLAVSTAKSQSGVGLLEDMLNAKAVLLAQAGDITRANQYADSAQKIAHSGHVEDLLSLNNDAQKGGALLSVFVPVGTAVKGVTAIAGAARSVKAAEEIGKVSGEIEAGAKLGADGAQVKTLDAAASTPTNPSAYSSAYEMKLQPSDFGRSRSVHFNRANASLDETIKADSEFAELMEGLMPGVQNSVSSVGGRATPAGWVWEHASTTTAAGEKGVMRLVPIEQHTPGSPWWRVLHPDHGAAGGYSEWAIPAGAPKN